MRVIYHGSPSFSSAIPRRWTASLFADSAVYAPVCVCVLIPPRFALLPSVFAVLQRLQTTSVSVHVVGPPGLRTEKKTRSGGARTCILTARSARYVRVLLLFFFSVTA